MQAIWIIIKVLRNSRIIGRLLNMVDIKYKEEIYKQCILEYDH